MNEVTHTINKKQSCVLFYFYIKPQHRDLYKALDISCVLFYFYIKPQPFLKVEARLGVVSYSISTSNHNSLGSFGSLSSVVSYSISTSNHNYRLIAAYLKCVVSYSISTSNHN